MHRDTHFLERSAARLDRPELEFALRLWDEPDTLRRVLADLNLPPTVDHVALALGLDGDGPWLVVTSGGQFVTCLGRGMAPKDAHVVPATQVAALFTRARRRAAELDEAAAHAADGPPRLMRRLVRPGPWLSREDFRAFAAWQPALVDQYVDLLLTQTRLMQDLPAHLGRVRARQPKAVEAELRRFWDAYWGAMALVPLLAHGGRERDLATALGPRMSVYFGTLGEFTALLRFTWAAGRFGKPVVPELKERYRDFRRPRQQLTAWLSLVTIALRHKSLRGEIAKVLTGTGHVAGQPHEVVMSQREMAEWARRAFDDADGLRAIYLQTGREYVDQVAGERGGALRQRFADADAVPDDVAGPLLSLALGPMFEHDAMLGAAIASPAWLADVEAPELFLPADAAALLREPWRHEDALGLYERLNPQHAPGAPVRVAPTAGRNEPCPCGSGRKFKRCCQGTAVGEQRAA